MTLKDIFWASGSCLTFSTILQITEEIVAFETRSPFILKLFIKNGYF